MCLSAAVIFKVPVEDHKILTGNPAAYSIELIYQTAFAGVTHAYQ